MLISISEVEAYVKKQGFVVVDKSIKGIVVNIKGSMDINVDFDSADMIGDVNVVCMFGVNVWLWPRMFLMNLVNLISRALTLMVCFLYWYVFLCK